MCSCNTKLIMSWRNTFSKFLLITELQERNFWTGWYFSTPFCNSGMFSLWGRKQSPTLGCGFTGTVVLPPSLCPGCPWWISQDQPSLHVNPWKWTRLEKAKLLNNILSLISSSCIVRPNSYYSSGLKYSISKQNHKMVFIKWSFFII